MPGQGSAPAPHLAVLDHAPMGPRQYAIWLLASGGTLLDGFSIFSLGVAMPLLTSRFALSPLMVGLIGSALVLGAAVGAAIGGPSADRFGRKPLLLLDMAILAGGAFTKTVTGTFNVLGGATISAGNVSRGAQTGTATTITASLHVDDGTMVVANGLEADNVRVGVATAAGTQTGVLTVNSGAVSIGRGTAHNFFVGRSISDGVGIGTANFQLASSVTVDVADVDVLPRGTGSGALGGGGRVQQHSDPDQGHGRPEHDQGQATGQQLLHHRPAPRFRSAAGRGRTGAAPSTSRPRGRPGRS